MKFTTLAPTHAAAAARLHIAGQPGTFLTKLGPEVLTVFYRALPQSPVGFGFVGEVGVAALASTSSAGAASAAAPVIGFVAATTSTGQLFLELGTRHLPHFLPPLLRCFGQQPRLLGQAAQTLVYPFLERADRHGAKAAKRAELLSIMVEPAWRSQGIGAQLLAQLVAACAAREITLLDVTVDAANHRACAFYARHGFAEQQTFLLYGRAMCRYRLAIVHRSHRGKTFA